MSNISPNSLFHFTPKLSYLINILRMGFKPRYFYEELLLNESKAIRGHNIGIPMVCFCDISLAQISRHIKSYGNYGVGMTKEWAIRNRLNPVIYLNQDSLIADPLSIIGESGIKLSMIENPKIQRLTGQIINSWLILQMCSKPYVGGGSHRGKFHPSKKFYNEREWRYIPFQKNTTKIYGGLSKEIMLDKDKLSKANNELQSYSLAFSPDDVKYIFVKEESQIPTIVNELRKMKNQEYDSKKIDILTSKILTIRNLKEDF
jgi:hypothetical protein